MSAPVMKFEEVKPQPPQEQPPKPKNLVQKLCEVMAAVERVAKTGENKFHGYKYAKEADIVEAIRGELSQRNLFIFPSVISHARSSEITDIMVRWSFVDGDSGESRDCDIPGSGQDKGDKGVYKALTGSEKYFLMKSFLIPTGDDPEADTKEERKAKKWVEEEVDRQKAGKQPRNVPQRATTLFYTMPQRHNGNFAEFVNIQGYFASNLDKEENLRLVFSAHGARKTKDETALVPTEKLPALLEKLAGDCGVDVQQLKAAQ